MEDARPINPQQYFNDPDMPFYGYPKTEENIAAVKKLWEDAKPKAKSEDMVDLIYGTPGSTEGFYL